MRMVLTDIWFRRLASQLLSALVSNSFLQGFLDGRIYQGSFKHFCVPFLNCYSCPGAIAACPLGSFQSLLAGPGHPFPLYVTGILTLTGGTIGRAVCGWLCPFGLLQDVLALKPARKVRIPALVRSLKYPIMILTVILPLLILNQGGIGKPYFCQFLCPAGTLEGGILLALRDPLLREMLGPLFMWKSLVLVVSLVLMVFVYRPYCRTICPLGAFYGLLNRVSMWRIERESALCDRCERCKEVCPIRIDVDIDVNHPECIRCLDCVKVCPSGALSFSGVPVLPRSSPARSGSPGKQSWR